MAVDYGEVRTGIAVCDSLEMLGIPLCVINESYAPKLIDRIAALCDERRPERIVVGLPRNMDGTCGEKAKACIGLSEAIEAKTGIKTVTYDERLTSVIAHARLHEAGKKEKQHRPHVDAAAAAEILNDYLTARKNGKEI